MVLAAIYWIIGAFIFKIYNTAIQRYHNNLSKDEKKGGMLSELSAFADLGMGGG
jgi:hypothetical protein